MNNIDWNPYFEGKKLYGDDFSIDEIRSWYEDEKEAYADLGSGDKENYDYWYHGLNIIHGFNHIPVRDYELVVGLGAAYGYEFIPIQKQIKNIIIIDASEKLISHDVLTVPVEYKKPPVSGEIDLPDNSVDLVTSFGTLHHIPNVSFVISEIYRILKPRGYFIYREPVISMGDWRVKRQGLTKHERGIAYPIFMNIIKKLNFKIKYRSFCFSFLDYQIKSRINYPFMNNILYCYFDKYFSNLISPNLVYHPTSKFQKIVPQIFFVYYKKPKRFGDNYINNITLLTQTGSKRIIF